MMGSGGRKSGQRQTVVYFDDRQVQKYLRNLGRASKQRTIFAAASAKAALPIRRSARQKAKTSFNPKLAKFNVRTQALEKVGVEAPRRRKKTINSIVIKRGKRKYRGSAWVLGAGFSNFAAKPATKERVAKKGKTFPIVLKSGKVVWAKKIKPMRKNDYLNKAYDQHKSTTIRLFKIEVGKAVLKHAMKHKEMGGKAGTRIRARAKGL